jgi:hypothetical protein
VILRLAAALAALGAAAAAIVVVVLLLRSVPGPAPATTSSAASPSAPTGAPVPEVSGGRVATPTEPGFPSPPLNALVLAREAGTQALALAVKPGLVRVSVLRAIGGGQSGLRVSLRFGRGYLLPAEPCGPGCYQVEVEGIPQSPVTVGMGDRTYRFVLPKLPAADGGAIIERATAVWNDLKTLVWRERLASSPTNVLHTVYRAVAPDKLAYTIRRGSAAVIIGSNRWDRAAPAARWQHSVQDPPVRQPQPFWRGATDAYVLGTGRVGSHRVVRVSFFDPATPAWFEATIDRRSYRTLALEMIAASHFMHDLYGPFDAAFDLHPPATT